MRIEPGRTPALVLAATALLAAMTGCTIASEPGAPDAPGATDAPDATIAAVRATPVPTADVTKVANEAVFGKWRRAPAYPTPEVKASAEQACRDQAAVDDLPLAVLDARGDGEVTIVFADDEAAVVCFATLTEDGSATAKARAVAGYPESGALDPEKLGVHDAEVFDDAVGARFVVFGRVGDGVHDVGASFDDWTWGKASMANGWYVIWWPGSQPALTIAASDRRSVAIDSYTP